MRWHGVAAWLVVGLAVTAYAEDLPSDTPKGGKTLGDLLEQEEEDREEDKRVRVEASKPDKTAAPSKAAIDEAAALIRDLYKKEIAAAKTPTQRSDLARVLLKQANDSRSDPAGYFVLLDEAASLAAKGGDTITAFQALDRLTSAFDVPAIPRKLAALEALSASSPPPAHKQIAELALALVDQAMASDDYKMAKDLVSIGAASSRKSKDAASGKIAGIRAAEIEKLIKQYATIKEALATIEKTPDDAKANQAAGTYFCFTKGNWGRGLPMLAKGDDAALKRLAEKDLAKPGDSSAQLAIGDDWWDFSQTQEGPTKVNLQVHACDWYRKALPKATGLAKAKAEKRVADVSAELAKTAGGVSTLPLFARVQDAVKNKKLNHVRAIGYSFGEKWTDIPEQGGILTGLDIGLNPNDGSLITVQAYYTTQRGEVAGKLFGVATPVATKLRAKPGYAIGAMTMREGYGIGGIVVKFMQMQGDTLNPAQSYDSEYVGGRLGDNEDLDVSGEPIVGIHGCLKRDGSLGSIGTVTPGFDGLK